MDLPVLIESLGENGFRARLGEPLPLVAEGATKEEALAKLQLMLNQQRASGRELTTLSYVNGTPSSTVSAGIWDENDPDVQDWLRIIQENRRLADIAEGIER